MPRQIAELLVCVTKILLRQKNFLSFEKKLVNFNFCATFKITKSAVINSVLCVNLCWIFVLVLTSFHLLCIKNAFSNHTEGLKSYCNGEMQSLFLVAMPQIPNFTIFAVIFCAKHTKNTPEFQLHCWSHVCKVNEWCLVNCFHHKFRDATQKWYLIIASWNVFCLW